MGITHSIMKEINQCIKEGYDLLNDENVQEACDKWLKAWDKLTVYVDEFKSTSIEEVEESFDDGIEDLCNWVQDLEMELENAGLENKEFFKKRAIYVKDFCNRLPESDGFVVMSMKLAEAESYFELEDIEKAEQLFEETQKEYKESVWPYLKWGDVYWLSSILRQKREYMNIDKALCLYKKGLGKESDMDYVLEDRISDLKKVQKNM